MALLASESENELLVQPSLFILAFKERIVATAAIYIACFYLPANTFATLKPISCSFKNSEELQ